MKNEIIRMAREAGLHRQQHNLTSNPVQYRYSYNSSEESLERFYDLAVQHEREECAKVAEFNARMNLSSDGIASKIRARGEKQ